MVVVDCFSKYAVFIHTPSTCPIEEVAKLFHGYVMKYFGLLKDIISDRNICFTAQLWTILFNLMGSNLKFSMANHPQMDG